MSRRPVGHAGARCGAKNRDGSTCKHEAGWATDHLGEGPCKTHGGCTPTVSHGAHLRLVEREARELFGKITTKREPIDNPLAAYAVFAAQVMDWLDHMERLLDDVRNVEVTSKVQGEQVAAKVVLYERAMDRANTVLATYARLNIDTRLAAITDAQAQTVMRAIEAVIVHLGADGPRAAEARGLAARHLRPAA